MKYLMLLLGAGCLLMVVVHTTKREGGKAEEGPGSGLNRTKGAVLDIQFKEISDALDSYQEESHGFPDSLESLVPRYLPSENELVDPWGTRMALRQDAGRNLILISAGQDRVFDSPDDVKRRIE